MAEKKIDEAGATPVVQEQKGSRPVFEPLAKNPSGV